VDEKSENGAGIMSGLKLAIVDYGMGNIRSVRNAFARLGCDVQLVQTAAELNQADALILPGVGAFGEAMSTLHKLELTAPIIAMVKGGKPLLGICLGMQLLAESSEERGQHTGLGLIPGKVKRIDAPKGLRLPHVGWNSVSITIPAPLFLGAREGESFYFVHSYHFMCDAPYRSAVTEYGAEVVAAVQHGHIFGVQFHPERSQGNGLRLLSNFVEYVGKRKMSIAC
jgi:glutamine amidotransferase